MPVVVAVASDATHRFSKPVQPSIMLVAGLGIAGDAHAGVTVQHLSRVRRDPTQPNLRQVHLVASELFAELDRAGFAVAPAISGRTSPRPESTCSALPTGTRLSIGASAVVEVTGLRNPCRQIDGFSDGLLKQVLARDGDGMPSSGAPGSWVSCWPAAPYGPVTGSPSSCRPATVARSTWCDRLGYSVWR